MRPVIKHHLVGEIVQSTANATLTNAVSEAVKTGELKNLTSNIYTTAVKEQDEVIIRRNLYVVLGLLYPGAVISHRSAIEAGPRDGNIVLSHTYTKKIRLPGITIHLLKGQGPQEGDMPFVGGLHLSSPERSWLENLRSTKDRGFRKTLTLENLELQLDDYLRVHGEEAFRERIEKAHLLAKKMGFNQEIVKFQNIVEALLGTRSRDSLLTERGLSRAKGVPFDHERVERFEILFQALMKLENIPSKILRSSLIESDTELTNFCFFDAYFSNYIEGTRFEIEEAREIIYEGHIPIMRPDSHDVIGTFQILQSIARSSGKPWKSVDEMIMDIRLFHRSIMKAHPDKKPGEFKVQKNFAGTTEFVAPDYVVGTLGKGFEFLNALPYGFQRAAFAKFLIAEVHPFSDGNGRLSRIVMNREFHLSKEVPIIIPTVYRTDYLGAVKKLTKTNDPLVYLKMLRRAQVFAASLDFSSYDSARSGFSKARAFSDDPNDTLVF